MLKMGWQLNRYNRRLGLREELGQSLRSVALGLRPLENNLKESLELVSATISVPVCKILITDNLIRCIHRPSLPSLKHPSKLQGNVYDIYPPTNMTMRPSKDGLGTGVSIDVLVQALPLHGLEYRKEYKDNPLAESETNSGEHWRVSDN